MLPKQPLDIDTTIERLRQAVRPFPKAALFELADEGYRSPFEQLLACIISIRTRDETTLPVARHLFAQVRTPAEVSKLTPAQLDQLLVESTFHEPKSRQIHAIACQIMTDYRTDLTSL